MNEQELAEMKRRTVPQHESNIWRNPLNNQPSYRNVQPKQYSEVEIVNQQSQYKQNYHNPFLKDLMQSATQVLLKIMEDEKHRT